jgi:uncharacterized paraquat-inducible protein A
VYTLAVLIAFFSGAWPYMKLAVMGVCWVSPSEFLSVKKREEWLRLMDILGKWSLIDFFVMVMMMCAFMFNLVLGDNLAVYVTVVPKWGFYGFLLATLISLGKLTYIMNFGVLVVSILLMWFCWLQVSVTSFWHATD